MATPIRPFLDPEELEILINHHMQKSVEAAFSGKYEEKEQHLARAIELEGHRSISG